MNCTIKNPANHDLGDLETHIHEMYDFFASKYGFKKPPTMVFDSDPSNQSNVLGKTAYYDPQSLEIHIFVDGRHSKDMLRSIAHELIHHRQNLEDRLDTGGYNGPGYYLENDELKDIEHEAMLEGNATMREYEDTKKYKENKDMSLNEWKNNELNQLLMKKFGILKEEKKKMVKGPDGKMVPHYTVDGKGEKDNAEDLDESISGSKEKPQRGVVDDSIDDFKRRMADEEQVFFGAGESEEDPKSKDLDESNCGSHKRDDDVSEGKECDKCKSNDCDCKESPKEKIQEALKRIANAKRIFLKNKRIK